MLKGSDLARAGLDKEDSIYTVFLWRTDVTHYKAKIIKPPVGLEPTTCSLRMSCSTKIATNPIPMGNFIRLFSILHYYSSSPKSINSCSCSKLNTCAYRKTMSGEACPFCPFPAIRRLQNQSINSCSRLNTCAHRKVILEETYPH